MCSDRAGRAVTALADCTTRPAMPVKRSSGPHRRSHLAVQHVSSPPSNALASAWRDSRRLRASRRSMLRSRHCCSRSACMGSGPQAACAARVACVGMRQPGFGAGALCAAPLAPLHAHVAGNADAARLRVYVAPTVQHLPRLAPCLSSSALRLAVQRLRAGVASRDPVVPVHLFVCFATSCWLWVCGNVMFEVSRARECRSDSELPVYVARSTSHETSTFQRPTNNT